jgi:BirA family biotin operon repressor/biotin-[acetyl-CoA-carboxylase] ligase
MITPIAGSKSAQSTNDCRSSDLRLDQLTSLLLNQRQGFRSQAELAGLLGVSPTELSGHLARLQAEGLPVEVVSGQWVRLKEPPDLLLASLVRPHLATTHLGWQFHHYFKVGSTNDAARDLAVCGAPEGTVVVAEEQTRGRGRLGRSWVSRKGEDITLSLVLRPNIDPSEAPALNLMVGLAAAEAIRDVAGVSTDLKWPNDVLTRGKKCCGVLTEMSADSGKVRFIVIGVGINVNGDALPEVIAGRASTLRREAGCRLSRARLVGAFLNHLEDGYLSFLKNGLQPFIKRWTERSSSVRGRRVVVAQPAGSFSGTTVGLSQQGALLVRREGGPVEEVLAGDIVQW